MAVGANSGAQESPRAEWRRVSQYVAERGAGSLARELADAFRANDLLTYASAISYQVVYAVIPTALALIALLGFLDLTEIWSERLAPLARERLSDAVFTLLDRTVERILSGGQLFWATAGAAIALWQVSGAVRATMGALNRVYGAQEHRSFAHRLVLSVGLALGVSTSVVLALVVFHLGPRVGELVGIPPDVVAAVRWLPAGLLLLVSVVLLTRYAPADSQPARWMGLVSLAIVVAWLLASLVFGLYVLRVGTYATIYGSLAAVILSLTYVYLSVVIFLGGLQLDALVRGERASVDPDDET